MGGIGAGVAQNARTVAREARRAKRAAAKALLTKKRQPAPLPAEDSASAPKHPTAFPGGLDELLVKKKRETD